MRTETMSIKEFMNRGKDVISPNELEVMKKGKTAGAALGLSLLPLAFSPLTKAIPAMATNDFNQGVEAANRATDVMYDSMLAAFEPLTTLIQSLAYPIAMVVVLGGAIMVMIRQQEKGYSMMMGAGLGYVLVQISPMFLKVLAEAMKAV